MPDHSGQGKAQIRFGRAVIFPHVPVGVSHDGLAGDLVKSYGQCRMPGCCGEWNGRKNHMGIAYCPLKHLHPTD